jgi:hypothetical protein
MSCARTAFVFAGGGSLGAVQVGMLRELMHAAVSADFCASNHSRLGNAVQSNNVALVVALAHRFAFYKPVRLH